MQPVTTRLQQQINFLLEADKLKNVIRRNYLTDDSRRENVAEHSWHVILTAMVLQEESDLVAEDFAQVIRLLAVHDLVEIYAGDVFLFDQQGNEGKFERELEAARKLFALLPPHQEQLFLQYWLEFEEQQTTASQIALCFDRIIPVIINTHSGGLSWREAGITRSTLLGYMEPVKKTSASLWNVLLAMVNKAVTSGALADE